MDHDVNLNGISSDVVRLDSTTRNRLLAALPRTDWERVLRHLTAVETPAGKALCEPESRLEYAYFPTTAIISLLHVAADGASTEVATVGNEGFVGVTLFTGSETTPNRVTVQTKGHIYRIKAEFLKEEFNRGGAVQRLLLRYIEALLTQISQTAVCNRRHSIDQQLCRWLLLSLDRLTTHELAMTHELLANTLGVRREGITEAAHRLQCAGLIHYRRGRITIIDRSGIEACCCECYGVVRREYDRLVHPGAGTLHRTPLATAVAVARENPAPRNAINGSSQLSAV